MSITHFRLAILSAFVYMLVACGGGGGGGTTTVTNSSTNTDRSVTIASVVIPPGSTCAFGGVSIDSGFDNNGNGVLDSGEVDKSYVICNGDSGLNSLIAIYDEPAGTNCTAGGKKISSGLDTNRDGTLDSSETTDTQYLCAIPPQAGTICSVVDNGDGTATISCPDGTSAVIRNGTNGINGVDGTSCSVNDNGDGTATVSCPDGTSAVISNGTNGLNQLTTQTVESAGVNCSNGGLRIDSGLDNNTNGVLDQNEITSTNYICNGSNGIPSGAIASIFCQGSFIDWTSIQWNYNVYLLTSQDVIASASIDDGYIATSKTEYYSWTQVGATTAAVIFTHDVLGSASYGWWKISLDRATLTTYLEYNDLVDLVSSPKTWYMTPDKCSVQSY